MAQNSTQQSRSTQAARKRREKMRALGLREIRIWVPDTRTPTFKEEARRQSLAVARSEMEKEDQAFVDALADRSET